MSKIITIDGPASAGKGTISRKLSSHLGYTHLDNGSIFRVAALSIKRRGIDIYNASDQDLVDLILSAPIEITWNGEMCQLYLDGCNVTHEISDLEIGKMTSMLASNRQCFTALAKVTRSLAVDGNFVSDGRAVGTFIFPEAGIKIFISATAEVRAQRRFQDLISQGKPVIFEDVLKDIMERDERDKNREFCPLIPPEGCIMIDTSYSTSEESLNEILVKIDQGENDEHLPKLK